MCASEWVALNSLLTSNPNIINFSLGLKAIVENYRDCLDSISGICLCVFSHTQFLLHKPFFSLSPPIPGSHFKCENWVNSLFRSSPRNPLSQRQTWIPKLDWPSMQEAGIPVTVIQFRVGGRALNHPFLSMHCLCCLLFDSDALSPTQFE